jgi:NTE family protein
MSMRRVCMALLSIIFLAIVANADNPSKIIIKPTLFPAQSYQATTSEPGIGLAVSGGGARGLAVIGILKVLDREHIKIKFASGVSIGSIVMGLYACGYSPDEIEQIAYQVNWSDILSPGPPRRTLLTTQKGQAEKSLFNLRFQGWKPVIPQAITSAQKLSQLLERLTARGGIRSSISFDYLNPPLRVVCTDLLTGEKVVLSSGSLAEALRASMAVPVAFTPAEIGGRLLVDGGLVDPIPVDVVADAMGHPVVAINVTSDLLPLSQINDIVGIADQTTTIMAMDKKQIALALADLAIIPDLHGWSATDFSHIDSLIRIGELAAEAALPAIKKLLSNEASHEGREPSYSISRTDICDLTLMPKTFFSGEFVDSARLSNVEIIGNLEKAYATGYLKEAWAELISDSTGVRLDYHLVDNSRIRIVNIQGAAVFQNLELYKLIESKSGAVFNAVTAERDRQALENYYIKSDYTLARVSEEFDSLTGLLIFSIDEGRINRIKIEGNHKTKNWVISRHLHFKQGDIFRQERGAKAIDDLYSTGLFETAKMVAIPDSSGIRLVVKVREKPYDYIRGGGRFDLEYRAQAFFDIVADNVFGRGQEIYLSTYIGEKKRAVSLNFRSDRILKTLFTSAVTFDYSEFKRNHYINHKYAGYNRQTSYGAKLAPGRQFPQLGMISVVGQLEQVKWEQPGHIGNQKFTKFSIGFESIVDTRDAISFPQTGKYHYFNLQFASDIRNEKTAYTRFETSLEAYYKLSDRLNFHPRLTVGASSDFMPYFDEFSLGGEDSFLGLYQDEVLGDKLVLGSLELRQRIGSRLYLMARYNAGNIWDNLERVRLSRLVHGGGVGLGLKTPIGPVEAWYGRTSAGRDAVYFDMGYRW